MPVDVNTYKLDEAVAAKAFTLTAATDIVAASYEAELVAGTRPIASAFLNAIATYGGEDCSVLDCGCSYGAQRAALVARYPKMRWAGVEVSTAYRSKVVARWPESEVHLVDSFLDMSCLKDQSYDVVTSRSMLCHYGHRNAFKIIDEMLRVARKAVVIKLYAPIYWTQVEFDRGWATPDDVGDVYLPLEGAKAGKGFLVEWFKPAWDEYIADKKVVEFEFPEVLCLLKP
jgi:hypothetical protein